MILIFIIGAVIGLFAVVMLVRNMSPLPRRISWIFLAAFLAFLARNFTLWHAQAPAFLALAQSTLEQMS